VNVPRYDFTATPNGVINWVANSTNVGAVVGTPGTAPTGWGMGSAGGVTGKQVVGFGVLNGVPYVDLRVFGTVSVGGQLKVNLGIQSGVAATFGQTWTASAWMQIIADASTTPIAGLNFVLTQSPGGGSTYLSAPTITAATLATWQRFSWSTPTTSAPMTTIQMSVWSTGGVSVVGDTVDITLRIGGAQLERSAVANAFVPTSNIAVNGTGVGALLSELAAANGIRNNTMAGAVVGTPGTPPTNWQAINWGGGGVTINVAALGTESGLPFVDFAVSGTASVTQSLALLFDTATSIAAAAGQTWAASVFVRLISGTVPANVVCLAIKERASGGSSILEQIVDAAPTPAGLATQRVGLTRTLSNGATAFVAPAVEVNIVLGVTYAFTVRIGPPQIELGSATSLILTSGSALIRAADTGVALDQRITFTRPSGASYFDATGTLQTAPSNTARIDFGPTPGGATNWLAPSIPGTGGWGVYGPATVTANATAAPDGSNTGALLASTDTSNNYRAATLALSAAKNEVLTLSAFVKRSSSGNANFYFQVNDSSGAVAMAYFDLGAGTGLVGADLAGGVTNKSVAIAAVGGGWYRCSFTFTTTATATNVIVYSGPCTTVAATGDNRLYVGVVGQGLYLWGFQLERAASVGGYVPTTTAAANVGAVPLGLLIEEGRTNSIRNPRAEGAVAGTPGTGPTNWFLSAPPQQVVGTGVENGISYVDARFTGSLTATFAFLFELPNVIAALPAQIWSASAYVRLVGGSLAAVTSIEMAVRAYSAAATGVDTTTGFVSQQSVAFTPTAAPLAPQRFSSAGFSLPASSAFVASGLRVSVAGAFDFTLRIGLPQIEQGGFATTPILPAIGTPATSSRNGDVIAMPVGPWLNPLALSLAAEATIPAFAGTQQGLMLLDDGSVLNRITLRRSGALINVAGVIAGSTTFNSSADTIIANMPFKTAAAVNAAGAAICFNGGTVVSSAGVTPSGLTALRLGQNATNSGLLNGYLRRARVWPRTLSNQELKAITL